MAVGLRELTEFSEGIDDCIKKAKALQAALPRHKVTDEKITGDFTQVIADCLTRLDGISKTVTKTSLEMIEYIHRKG
jgi:hypothetical protein